jgi:hypothetical protein
MRTLWGIADFIHAAHRQLRFGELSRAPLRLLRLEWRGNVVECDWIARTADEWDTDLPRRLSDRNVAEQALEDAIALRELLFHTVPGVDTALLRAFRDSANGMRELIIIGTVTRFEEVPRNVFSMAMRAKLLGLRFSYEDGSLEALHHEVYAAKV